MTLTYRRPGKKDLPETVKLLFKFRDDYSELFPTPDVDKVTATVQHHYEKGFIHNVYKDNKLIGSIGAAPSEWWFSPEEFISETWFYVLPEERSFSIATKLLAELKQYRAGSTVLLPISTGFDRPALYEKLKFNNMGTIWRYN